MFLVKWTAFFWGIPNHLHKAHGFSMTWSTSAGGQGGSRRRSLEPSNGFNTKPWSSMTIGWCKGYPAIFGNLQMNHLENMKNIQHAIDRYRSKMMMIMMKVNKHNKPQNPNVKCPLKNHLFLHNGMGLWKSHVCFFPVNFCRFIALGWSCQGHKIRHRGIRLGKKFEIWVCLKIG